MEIAPLRSLDDFVTGQSRFQIPDFANVERWFNRIVSNLLYYQTNYFLSAAIIFSMVTFFHPQEMIFGLIIVAIMAGGLMYAQSQKKEINDFKKAHPMAVTSLIFIVSTFIIYKLGSIVVFLLGIWLPLTFTLIHASLRLRNVKNKLVNASDALGLGRQTPMAYFLKEVGIEAEFKTL